jgi:uroporphyrinogen decarboxylase
MRDKVIDSIKHKDTSVPWHIDLTSNFIKKVQSERNCENVDLYLKNHLYRLKYKKNQILANGDETDIFGVTWTSGDDSGDVGIVSEYIMKDPDISSFNVPEIDKELCKDICSRLKADTENRFRMFNLTMNFFERSWSLRGMENILMDMLLQEDFTSKFYGLLFEHHMQVLDCVLDDEFEGVYFGDDWGQQQGLIMGPDLWRKYIKQPMKKMFEKIKSKGKFMILHSCGDLRDIMPDLVDMGLDVYNTVQPEIYDLPTLKKEYGKDLTFYGGISTQQFLPYATANEVYKKTMETLKIMAPGGGYILSPTHAVTDDIPVENIDALIKAAVDYAG